MRDDLSASTYLHSLGDAASDALLTMSGDTSTRRVLAKKADAIGISTDLAIEFFSTHAMRRGLQAGGLLSAINRGRAAIEKGSALCESPIEKRVLPWLVFGNYDPLLTMPAVVHDPKTDALPPVGDVMIVPQFAFAKFRVDFGLVGRWKGSTKIVAVECDGSAFHGATRDRELDVYLHRWGIETVRATGTEIKFDPHDITVRAANLLIDWAVRL